MIFEFCRRELSDAREVMSERRSEFTLNTLCNWRLAERKRERREREGEGERERERGRKRARCIEKQRVGTSLNFC